MEATEIIEGNKLIAEFMGSPVTKYKEDDYIYTSCTGQKEYASYDCELAVINNAVYEATELKYHLLFDWIMPVVERIESLLYGVTIAGDSCCIKNNFPYYERASRPKHRQPYEGSKLADSKIEATWSAVVDFVKFYNQNK